MPTDQPKFEWAKPLPVPLVRRYHSWRATAFSESKVWYQRLADEGQRPRYMVISCCDSRVPVTDILSAEPGELFVHRNVANLVPPYEPDGERHGTSAALEYAVCALKVTNLIIMGHSLCGGAKGCHDMCSGQAPELESEHSFVGRWMEILRRGFERVQHVTDEADRLRALEQQTVVVSLENLMSFPFVANAVEQGTLSLHGLWVDIASGELQCLHAETGAFTPV